LYVRGRRGRSVQEIVRKKKHKLDAMFLEKLCLAVELLAVGTLCLMIMLHALYGK